MSLDSLREHGLWFRNIKAPEYKIGDKVCYKGEWFDKPAQVVTAVRNWVPQANDDNEPEQQIQVNDQFYWMSASDFVPVRELAA